VVREKEGDNMDDRSDLIEYKLDGVTKKYGILAQIGIIILMIGIIIVISVRALDLSGDTAKVTYYGGQIIFYIGLLFLVLSMFTIALFAKNLHIYIRVALLITIGLLFSVPLQASLIY